MKLNILTTAAVLAIAGTALTQSAKAQFVGNSSDLILSFGDGTTTPTNYEIDLGQAGLYTSATSTINIANINTDLTAVFGSSYYTDKNLNLAILGVNSSGVTDPVTGAPNGSIFVSIPSKSNPFPSEANSTLNGFDGPVDTIYNPNGAGSNLPTAGSTVGSYKVPTANVDSFFSVQQSDGLSTNDQAAFSASGATPILYLETLDHAAGTKATTLGTTSIAPGFFDVTSTGEVQYVIAAAPEPSTYALMFLGAGVLFWHVRRKSVASL